MEKVFAGRLTGSPNFGHDEGEFKFGGTRAHEGVRGRDKNAPSSTRNSMLVMRQCVRRQRKGWE